MRVVIADDDSVVVESLRIVLDAQPDIEVVGCGTDGADAVRLAADSAPDIVLLDIQMPGMDGLSAAERILAAPVPPRVVFLTTFSDDEYIVRALALGVCGLPHQAGRGGRRAGAARGHGGAQRAGGRGARACGRPRRG